MKSRELVSKDETGLEQEFNAWILASPPKRVVKRHPISLLPLTARPITLGAKIEAPDRVSMRVDYED